MSQVGSDFWVFFLIFIWSTNYIFLTGFFSVCVRVSVYASVGACE